MANQVNNIVSQYRIDATGALTPLSPPTVSAGGGPSFVTVDPTGRWAYAVNNFSSTVSQYNIGATGTLTPLSPSTVGTDPQPLSITIDPNGRTAYVANWESDTVLQYRIGATGTLTPLSPATVSTPNAHFDHRRPERTHGLCGERAQQHSLAVRHRRDGDPHAFEPTDREHRA